MAVISTSWSCARCGAAYISTPPENGLCDDCTVRALREIFFGTRQIMLNASRYRLPPRHAHRRHRLPPGAVS